MNEHSPIVSQILGLFVAERDAIISGSGPELEEVSSRKELLLSDLFGQSTMPVESLNMIAKEAKRNEKFIAAYLSGIKGAKFDIGTIRAAASGMETYDSKGTRIHSPSQATISDRRV